MNAKVGENCTGKKEKREPKTLVAWNLENRFIVFTSVEDVSSGTKCNFCMFFIYLFQGLVQKKEKS